MKNQVWRTALLSVFILTLVFVIPASTLAVSASQPKTDIQIYSNPFGGATYVLSFALAEIINKNSEILHATCVESKGSAANILFLQNNPDALKKTLIVANPFATRQAEKADPPFRKPFTGLRAVSLIGNMGSFFVTLKPELKTVEDLKGKSLAIGPRGITLDFIPRFILEHGTGVSKKIGRISNMPFGAIKDALLDGTLDAGLQSSVMWGEEEEKEWVPIPTLDELLATKKCFLVDVPDDAAEKAREATGYPIYFQKAKKLAFGKSDAFGGKRVIWSSSWWAHESMDDEIVAEICRIIYEHASEFVKYHASGKAITQKTISSVAADEKDFHPAAIQFFKDKGLKIGQ